MGEAVRVFSASKISRRDNTLRFDTAKGTRYYPVQDTEDIHLFGECALNTKLLNFLAQEEIPVHVYSYYGYWSGSFVPRTSNVSGHVFLKQVEHYLSPSERRKLARGFVEGALRNLGAILAQHKESVSREVASRYSAPYLEKAKRADTIEQLMAIEGEARRNYYSQWDKIVVRSGLEFERRTRRPPANEMNAMISFGNGLLYTAALSEIHKTPLDPRIGFLHSANQRRYSLNLDLAEIFKPVLVDRAIFALLNRSQIGRGDFDHSKGGVHLKESARKKFVEEFEKRMKTTLHHEKLGRRVSYRNLLRMEVYKIEKHILDDQMYSPFVMEH